MKRVKASMVIAGAVASCIASSAFASAPEIFQYFGPSSTLGTPGNPVITATPGSDVTLPVWIRVQRSDVTTTGTGGVAVVSLRAFRYDVAGVASAPGVFSSLAAGGIVNNNLYPVCQDGNVGGTTLTSLPAATVLYSGVGCSAVLSDGASMTEGGSPSGLAYTDAANFAYYVGSIKVHIAAGAANGSTLDVFMATPQVVVAPQVRYAIAGQTSGTRQSVAYGLNGAGGLDADRAGAAAGTDILGNSGVGQASAVADATIRVIPEPATIGLLGFGLMALRRRSRA